MTDGLVKLRLDKWLWYARFFKTRGLSAKTITGGHVRVNSLRVAKPAFTVALGDVITFPQERDVRVIRIVELGHRRGPAPEAQGLYEDLDPPKPRDPLQKSPMYEGGGRPTKKDRRKLDQTRGIRLD